MIDKTTGFNLLSPLEFILCRMFNPTPKEYALEFNRSRGKLSCSSTKSEPADIGTCIDSASDISAHIQTLRSYFQPLIVSPIEEKEQESETSSSASSLTSIDVRFLDINFSPKVVSLDETPKAAPQSITKSPVSCSKQLSKEKPPTDESATQLEAEPIINKYKQLRVTIPLHKRGTAINYVRDTNLKLQTRTQEQIEEFRAKVKGCLAASKRFLENMGPQVPAPKPKKPRYFTFK